MNKRRKLFSKIERRKLFSDYNPEMENSCIRTLICEDCGFKVETSATTTSMVCPKCGGKRFNIDRTFFSPEGTPEAVPQEEKRFSLFSKEDEESRFQKSFSNTTSPFELRLKKYSGSNINIGDCERVFGKTSEEMVQKGFAEVSESGTQLNISKDAFLQSRLFSKLIVSVTKVLDLDPEITCAPEAKKIAAINSLGSTMCPKSVILIKKAHGVCPEGPCDPSWIEDSGILKDIPLEFGGRCMGLPEFEGTLNDRYPDAPSGLLDLLGSKGIIKINNDHVDILK